LGEEARRNKRKYRELIGIIERRKWREIEECEVG